MSDPNDVSSAMEAAQQAAGAGDFVTAERELRRAFDLQEAALGPNHPDLANTLNNLGVVSERLNKPAEAERYYRHAYTIASSVLQPDHPFVAMSAKNLRDFCEARGIPFERLPAAPASTPDGQPRASWPPARKPETQLAAAEPTAATAPNPASAAKPAPVAKAAPPTTRPPAAAKPAPVPRQAPSRPPEAFKRDPVPAAPVIESQSAVSPRTLAIAAIVVAAIVLGGLWTMRSSSSRTSGQTPPTTSTAPAPAPSASATPTAAPPPAEQSAPAEHVTPPPEPAPVQEQPKTPPPAAAAASPVMQQKPAAAPPRKQSSPPSGAASATLVSAQLCRPLNPSGNWNCTPPASSQVAPGVMFFYTRVTCPSDTTIEHRWYHNDRLLQNVSLRIRANSGPGYRTYSRTTITPERAGDWRVELRAADGTVLHEERFSVGR